MSKKMCKICGENLATVPDRTYENIGRFRPEVCQDCHAKRLAEDMRHILRPYQIVLGNHLVKEVQDGGDNYYHDSCRNL